MATHVLHTNHKMLPGDLCSPAFQHVFLIYSLAWALHRNFPPWGPRRWMLSSGARSRIMSLRWAPGQADDSSVGPWRDYTWLIGKGHCSRPALPPRRRGPHVISNYNYPESFYCTISWFLNVGYKKKKDIREKLVKFEQSIGFFFKVHHNALVLAH